MSKKAATISVNTTSHDTMTGEACDHRYRLSAFTGEALCEAMTAYMKQECGDECEDGHRVAYWKVKHNDADCAAYVVEWLSSVNGNVQVHLIAGIAYNDG